MSEICHIGLFEKFERDLFVLHLRDFSSMPATISLPGKHFVTFLAAKAEGVAASEIAILSERLIGAGCVWFSAWGKDCERVHDVFDESCFAVEP